jgi:hypothetical protein
MNAIASLDGERTLRAVRQASYVLIELAQGPVAAVLADSAARILDHNTGTLFC